MGAAFLRSNFVLLSRLDNKFNYSGRKASDACRRVLRAYEDDLARGVAVDGKWRKGVRTALLFLGGQGDRNTHSLADYDPVRYGPYLGVSDEGGAAESVLRAAAHTPKARGLGRSLTPLSVGLALDAERLGAIGELPVGPDEFAQIWRECVGRTLLTTNIGSRANIRLYKRPPTVIIKQGGMDSALRSAKADLQAAFRPFLEAPGGARPVVVYVQFDVGSRRKPRERRAILKSLLEYVCSGKISNPTQQRLGFYQCIAKGRAGYEQARKAIDLCSSAGISRLAIEGVVREKADREISLPGLLNYLPPEMVDGVLGRGRDRGVQVQAANPTDPDSIAREIWSSLNTARAMGLHLGKYGLIPLTLEECERVVRLIQSWFPNWSAAPVYYLDQGILTRERCYVGSDSAAGLEVWLKMIARHKVPVCLVDTVDKSQGWKILKSDGDPKGLLELRQIERLARLGERLGIRVLWAGGITLDQAFEFGSVRVFGIYVTTSASEEAPVTAEYADDPALVAEKRPTMLGVLKVKTYLEAGFLGSQLESLAGPGSKKARVLAARISEAKAAGPVVLSKVLVQAWRFWWGSSASVSVRRAHKNI